MDEAISWLTFYIHRLLHSTPGYISAMEFEENWRTGRAKKVAWTIGNALRLTGARSATDPTEHMTPRPAKTTYGVLRCA